MKSSQPAESALLRKYVNDGKLMQVATITTNNTPWLFHVWYAPTSELDLIFASNVARLHSDHIRNNSAVAGGIIAIRLEGLGQKVQGVTFIGNAHECVGRELEEAYETYAARWEKARENFPLNRIKSAESPMRLYQITPKEYVLFDEKNFSDQPKRVISEW